VTPLRSFGRNRRPGGIIDPEASLSDPKDVREFPRVEAAFRVRYATRDKLEVFVTRDLSKGGMFLATKRMLPINSVVKLFIELPDGGGEVGVICRVAHVRGEGEAQASGKPVGIGIQFLDTSEANLARVEQFLASQGAASPAPINDEREPIKLVVADENERHRERAAAPFRARGDFVRSAADGVEALQLCLKEPPDVLLTDVSMQRMDGWDLLRVLRGRPALALLPVVMVTAISGEDDRFNGYQLGCDDYITKPYQAEELLLRVDRIISRARRVRTTSTKGTLRGDLSQMSIGSVLSLLELERKTGQLLIVGPQTARVWVRAGRPVRVEIEGHNGTHTTQMMQVLDSRTGQFEFAPQDVSTEDEVDASVTELLLEHARRTDEGQRDE
jgi:uncharacterized protein (TIGR02266 family)